MLEMGLNLLLLHLYLGMLEDIIGFLLHFWLEFLLYYIYQLDLISHFTVSSIILNRDPVLFTAYFRDTISPLSLVESLPIPKT